MITAAVTVGLGATWAWVVLNDDEGVAAPLTRLLRKSDITRKWMECPWCSGAWFALAGTLAVYRGDWLSLLVVWLAAATVVGVLGSYLGES